MMKKLATATALLMAFAAPALAGPKDQTKLAMIGRQAVVGNATVDNATTDFKVATKGCKLQISAKGLVGVADNSVIICIGGADVLGNIFASPAGNSIVVAGEVFGGSLKLKGDLKEIGCGTSHVIQFNPNFRCYLDDATYRSTDSGPGSWGQACLNVSAAALANATVGADELKNHPGQRVIPGICQSFSNGVRIDPPSSAEIAVAGGRQFCDPKLVFPNPCPAP